VNKSFQIYDLVFSKKVSVIKFGVSRCLALLWFFFLIEKEKVKEFQVNLSVFAVIINLCEAMQSVFPFSVV